MFSYSEYAPNQGLSLENLKEVYADLDMIQMKLREISQDLKRNIKAEEQQRWEMEQEMKKCREGFAYQPPLRPPGTCGC